MNCYAPFLQNEKEAGGNIYPNHETCGPAELASAGTKFWDVSAPLVWKTEHRSANQDQLEDSIWNRSGHGKGKS